MEKLPPSQKSMVVARAREMYDKAAKERKTRKPKDSVPVNLPEQNVDARDAAGKAVGVSGKTVMKTNMDETDWEMLLIEAGRGARIPRGTTAVAMREARRLFDDQRTDIHHLAARAILALLELATQQG